MTFLDLTINCRFSYDSLTNQMFSHSKNIAVNPGACVDNNCQQNCDKTECELCLPCLNEADLNGMLQAYREHVKRGGFKRIFPSRKHFADSDITLATSRNKISMKWFKAKCEENNDWC